MKYNLKDKMLTFSSDEEALRFHDQLTSALRIVMLNTGGDKAASQEEDIRLTQEFFDRYSMLAETLRRMRAHMMHEMEA